MFRKKTVIKQENPDQEIQITMNELPWDVLVIIFSQLNLTSLGALLLTNKKFFNLLISPNANFVWETQIAHHFPNRYQQFENAKQFPDNSYQAFLGYYKSDEAYQALTREEKRIFSYLKEENIKALSNYDLIDPTSGPELGDAHIGMSQIPFHFLEWVAEHASQAFKEYLYNHVYKKLIESDNVSDYFDFFRNIESTWPFYQNKEDVKKQILTQYDKTFLFAYVYLKVMTLFFLGKGLDLIPWKNHQDRRLDRGFFDYLYDSVIDRNREFARKFFGAHYKKYVKNFSWYLGRYCSSDDVSIIQNQILLLPRVSLIEVAVERGDQAVLSAFIGSDIKMASEAVLQAVKKNNIKLLEFILSTCAEIKTSWAQYLPRLDIIRYGTTLESFQYLSRHLIGFYALNDNNRDQDQLKINNLYLECAILLGRMDLVDFFIGKGAKFYEQEKASIHVFCLDMQADWRFLNILGEKLFFFKPASGIRTKSQFALTPPTVRFYPLTAETQNLPNQSINFFMVNLLSEWYRYECLSLGRQNQKLQPIADLILHVINHQDRYFEDLVAQWKNTKPSSSSNETNLDIIMKKQGNAAIFSKATKTVVDSVMLPAISFFSDSKEAAEWMKDTAKTNTEKFIDKLVKGACLYAKPRVELSSQSEDEPENEKPGFKKQ